MTAQNTDLQVARIIENLEDYLEAERDERGPVFPIDEMTLFWADQNANLTFSQIENIHTSTSAR